MARPRKIDEHQLVWFTGHDNPFLMAEAYCDNPDCPCRTVSLAFLERDIIGSAIPDPIRFSIRLDTETWEEHDVPERSELVSRLVAEFLRDLSEDTKTVLRRELDIVRRTKKGLATFSMPAEDVRQGRMVAYSEILVDEQDARSERMIVSFSFDLEGQKYCVEDYYCPNPTCNCREVHLVFLNYRRTQDTTGLYEFFGATLTLKNKIEITKTHACSRAQAGKLLTEWQASYPDYLDDFKRRYRDIKKVGKRILKQDGSRAQPEPPPKPVKIVNERRDLPALPKAQPSASLIERLGSAVPAGASIGRNAPCPCGSGRKYKKCCGRGT